MVSRTARDTSPVAQTMPPIDMEDYAPQEMEAMPPLPSEPMPPPVLVSDYGPMTSPPRELTLRERRMSGMAPGEAGSPRLDPVVQAALAGFPVHAGASQVALTNRPPTPAIEPARSHHNPRRPAGRGTYLRCC